MTYKVIENHPNDSRVKYREDDVFQTLSSRMGTGGAMFQWYKTQNQKVIMQCDG